MGMQQWLPLALLSSYKIFRTATDNISYLDLHEDCQISLYGLDQIWSFSSYFHDKIHISNFTKISPVGATLIHADKQTDRT